MTLTLNQIRHNVGANVKRKRIGRGRGSGKGGSAGRGFKGFKSRSGTSVAGFEGGQTPLYRRLPKHGFNSIFKKKYNIVNLQQIKTWIDSGRVSKTEIIQHKYLVDLKLLHKDSYDLKILGFGNCDYTLNVKVHKISKSAKSKIESAGGTVEFVKKMEKKNT